VEGFISKHSHAVTGTLSGFDRLVFRGTLRMLAHCGGMMSYLYAVKVLLKDFAGHAEAMTKRLRRASEALAEQTGRPIRYLSSSITNKEDIAREIARADGIEQGLICILTAVEPCLSYEIVRDRDSKFLDLKPRHRKCLFLYHYRIPSPVRLHARPHPDLVSVRHSDLPQWKGVAGPFDGCRRSALRPTRQLFHLAGRPGTGTADAGPAGAVRLA
jgi:hypothetical protein